ncbi:prolactin-releasing peptide [Erpetoichthys calabaricus]|uniref:prolactin-releasing peptide n=1 Tax=Erpetoichthys calabaricus TaxID=27687 RepID=UPI0022342D33|nr:prolactin-releasing peptide [Erpetoichthys calabaricus]
MTSAAETRIKAESRCAYCSNPTNPGRRQDLSPASAVTPSESRGMKVFAACCVFLLLLCVGCPNADCRIQERSMEIRNPDIDASWYTGRGIRPVGRFGRRASEVRRGSDYPSHRFCIPVEENDDSSLDE